MRCIKKSVLKQASTADDLKRNLQRREREIENWERQIQRAKQQGERKRDPPTNADPPGSAEAVKEERKRGRLEPKEENTARSTALTPNVGVKALKLGVWENGVVTEFNSIKAIGKEKHEVETSDTPRKLDWWKMEWQPKQETMEKSIAIDTRREQGKTVETDKMEPKDLTFKDMQKRTTCFSMHNCKHGFCL